MKYSHDGCVLLNFNTVFEVLLDEFDFNSYVHWTGRPGRTSMNVRTSWLSKPYKWMVFE